MRVCNECGTEYEGAEVFCPKDGGRIVDPNSPEENIHKITTPPVAVDADPLIGKVVQSRYKILSKLGEGGMGVVYVALHIDIEKKMALKVLRDDFSKKPDVVERFRQEARSASKIGDPHIVDVTDFGQLDDGGVFFVMEILEGSALDEICADVCVPLDRAAPIIDQIAKGLQAAHDLGIVHRDLKPENVFLINRDEQIDFVKILDFGIAKISDTDSAGKKLTQTGMIFGTPEYMSPEQAAGKSTDHRVDIYALGCIMFELFTGKVPYTGDSFMAILTQHMFEPIPDIKALVPDTDVPDSVLNVVYKAMTKEAKDRYKDMHELRADLAQALQDSDFEVDFKGRERSASFSLNRVARDAETLAGVQSQKRSKSKPGIIIAAGLIIVLIGLLIWFFGFNNKDKKIIKEAPATISAPLPEITLDVVEIDTADKEEGDKKLVTVILGSIPAGAVISVEGMGQVCSNAPCDIELQEGKPLEITASVADISKKKIFTPSEQNKELIIELDLSIKSDSDSIEDEPVNKRIPKKRKIRKKRKTGQKSSGGGLKIPDVFKNN